MCDIESPSGFPSEVWAFTSAISDSPKGVERPSMKFTGTTGARAVIHLCRNTGFSRPDCIRGGLLGLSHQPPWPWCRNTRPSRLAQYGRVFDLNDRQHDPPVLRVFFEDTNRCAPSLLSRSILTFHRSFPRSSHVTYRLPLLRFSKDRPSAVSASRVLSQLFTPKSDSLSARCCHASNTFRPCRSSRLRRFAPRETPQVYCTLLPAMGFESFPASPPASSFATFRRPRGFSRTRPSYPPECSPRR